jgi:hypothetical protein
MVLIGGLLLASLSLPALAWEFGLTGNFIWRYDYVTQTGSNGFFGRQDEASPGLFVAAGPNWAAMNGWAGARTVQGSAGTQYGLVTGKDASFNYQRMELATEIRLNPAIRLRGV